MVATPQAQRSRGLQPPLLPLLPSSGRASSAEPAASCVLGFYWIAFFIVLPVGALVSALVFLFVRLVVKAPAPTPKRGGGLLEIMGEPRCTLRSPMY